MQDNEDGYCTDGSNIANLVTKGWPVSFIKIDSNNETYHAVYLHVQLEQMKWTVQEWNSVVLTFLMYHFATGTCRRSRKI